MSGNVAIAAVIAFKAIIKTAKFKITTFKAAAFKATAVQTNVWQCCNRRNNSLNIALKHLLKQLKQLLIIV